MSSSLKILVLLVCCVAISLSAKPGKIKIKVKPKHLCPYKPCGRGKKCVHGICVGKPFPIPLPGPCYHKNCPPKKVCKAGKCVCRTGIEIGGKCVPIPKYCPYVPCGLGYKCYKSKCINANSCYIKGCRPGKVCKDGKCVCRIGYDYNGKCISCPAPKVPKRCPTSCPATCQNLNPQYCTKECDLSRRCVCPQGMVQVSKTNQKCILPKKCKNYCGGKVCPKGFRCIAGICVLIAIPICPKPCSPYSHCVAGRCICLLPYFDYAGRCTKPCWNNHCPLHSTCHHGKCLCNAGFVKYRGQCIALLPSCASVRCPDGYICREGHCIALPTCATLLCAPGYVCSNGECIPKPLTCADIGCAPGHYCKNGKCIPKCHGIKVYTECATSCPQTCDNPNPAASTCITGCRPHVHCVCPRGTYEQGGADGVCVEANQCKRYCGWGWCPPNSICSGDRCVCVAGFGPQIGCEWL